VPVRVYDALWFEVSVSDWPHQPCALNPELPRPTGFTPPLLLLLLLFAGQSLLRTDLEVALSLSYDTFLHHRHA
jgi:hypothetical protein